MKTSLMVGCSCLLILSAGCGKKPAIGALSRTSVVVAFGDSLTAGTGAESPQDYPSVLSELLRCRVVNAGVPGEDTSGGLERLPRLLQAGKIDLVVLCHGGNDMLQKQDESTTMQNLDQMISMVRDAGADVVLVGVPTPGFLLKTAPFYHVLADNHQIPFDDETLAEILSSASLKSDHVHPNAAGYRQLARAVADLIVESQVARQSE